MIAFEIPLRTGRGQNDRMHWRAKARQKKAEREVTALVARSHAPALARMPLPLTVTLTRVAPGNGLDDDNNQGALKSIRDEIAQQLGIDDKDLRVQYLYAQERGPWGVRVEIREVAA